MKLYTKICKWCNKEFETNNKHRKSCYECKIKYPYKANAPRGTATYTWKLPFNRKSLIIEK